ncbi:type 2 periplasmic-binding domain-containing protein [Paracoccus sediminilitoris]|uniref:hypothetical protein n=1 Tax=Paracoccus sediminilitoris TaxID=2202419 RepID=UPI001F4656FF|nr:hypothetical protein [Paracoccus sediminilitoris]
MAMNDQGLLADPFLSNLPNAQYLDLSPHAPHVRFHHPTEGRKSPCRLARFVFIHDSERTPTPPRDMAGFVAWAAAHPGRMTHPDPSNFMGATFLKQALVEMAPDPQALMQPVTDQACARQTAPPWDWYDALRPNLWRQGQAFPENKSIQQQLLNDG